MSMQHHHVPHTAPDAHSESEPQLSLEGVTMRYEGDPVFTGLDLAVDAGDVLCLLGPSGCGKTTLLHLLAGLEEPTDGTVRFEGESIEGPDYRRGLVFQEPLLYPWLSVAENVAFGPTIRGAPQDPEHVASLLEMIGLEDHADDRPADLSGGMAQRVSLARTLANDPAVLLLDEPFSALDQLTKIELQDELRRIVTTLDVTTVFVTHDIEEAVALGDRVAVMDRPPHGIVAERSLDLDDAARDSEAFRDAARSLLRLFKREVEAGPFDD